VFAGNAIFKNTGDFIRDCVSFVYFIPLKGGFIFLGPTLLLFTDLNSPVFYALVCIIFCFVGAILFYFRSYL
jgi:hypothetical protein